MKSSNSPLHHPLQLTNFFSVTTPVPGLHCVLSFPLFVCILCFCWTDCTAFGVYKKHSETHWKYYSSLSKIIYKSKVLLYIYNIIYPERWQLILKSVYMYVCGVGGWWFYQPHLARFNLIWVWGTVGLPPVVHWVINVNKPSPFTHKDISYKTSWIPICMYHCTHTMECCSYPCGVCTAPRSEEAFTGLLQNQDTGWWCSNWNITVWVSVCGKGWFNLPA